VKGDDTMLSNAQDNALLESQNSDFARGFVSGDFLPAMQAKRSYPEKLSYAKHDCKSIH
jgi:hypothetical protein